VAVKRVKEIKPNAKVYWLDTAGTGQYYYNSLSANTDIKLQQPYGDYEIIFWSRVLWPTLEKEKPRPYLADGIHPNKKGYQALAGLVAGVVTK
jgi:lysophospholipase L1-like esterase